MHTRPSRPPRIRGCEKAGSLSVDPKAVSTSICTNPTRKKSESHFAADSNPADSRRVQSWKAQGAVLCCGRNRNESDNRKCAGNECDFRRQG